MDQVYINCIDMASPRYDAGPLFTKYTDVLPLDLVKPRNHEIRI